MENGNETHSRTVAVFQNTATAKLFSRIFGEHYTAAYAYKKTQRITSAVHLVTGYIPEQEPIRSELRTRALLVLSGVISLTTGEGNADAENALERQLFEIVSLLEIACAAGFISEMNTDILRREYVGLAQLLSARQDANAAPSALTESYFDVSDQVAEPTRSHKDNSDARDNQDTKKTSKTQKIEKKDEATVHNSKRQQHVTNRQKVILDLVHKKGRINVKDAAAVIFDCSEKTLQRELLALVEQGVLKKEGERRWSTYTLNV